MAEDTQGLLDIYRRAILPLAGIVEAVTSQGKSPGTVAMRSMGQFDQADALRREEEDRRQKNELDMAQAAREKELFGYKKSEYDRNNVDYEREQATLGAYRKRMEGVTDEKEQEQIALDLFKKEYPKEYAMTILKSKDPGLYDMLKLQLLQGQVKQQQNPRLSQATVDTMTELANFPNLLSDLRQGISKNKDIMGPGMGRLQGAKGFVGFTDKSTLRAQGLQQTYESVKQVVAKAMEGGVLRKEDMPKYEKILGSILLTPEAAYQNIGQLEKMLARDYNNKRLAYEAQGYDIRGINPIEIKTEKPKASDFEE